ncbi:M12 family metallo-peptidase [Flavobacterium sp. SM15]|uniref:reprolysin-like metallopeptidase n=1 Tax=Flavobacterium sp. SM15 TaxID=2908005 RepID=UPI001EDBA03D|nr:zinc-dependent metalloprotease family protein [Flavobacterium sp. SM15]MCG2612177.1 M12 family metallo-peptidase [Flavobacterium sp. SM15]
MKKILLIAFLQLMALSLCAQKKALWAEQAGSELPTEYLLQRTVQPKQFKIFTLDLSAIQQELKNAPSREVASAATGSVITIPNDEGVLERFTIVEASVMEPELQARFPEIRSYAGQSMEHPSTTIRFSVSPQKGFSAIIRTAEKGTLIIDPLTKDLKKYIVFRRSNNSGSKLPFDCSTPESMLSGKGFENEILNNADDSQLRRFRLAMSCTGEYTSYHGGTVAGAMAAINTTVTRVNGVFENDFNATMVLIATNSNVVYTNAATDPYSPAAQLSNWNAELQANLTAVIGEANYDVGHLFGATGGGGNAGCIGCVCVNGQKGSGYTSPADGIPQGDNFDIDYVAHEIGHQFGANHTFTHSTQVAVAQLEPGSGSTIMGYAGITGATDVQAHSDAYFHAISIQQVTNNIKGKACAVVIPTGNAVPTANAGADKLFPIGTAFKLTGSGTDANGNGTLTYCWEQMDIGDATTTYPSTTKTSGPNYRSFTPTASPTRRLPNLAGHVANGVNGNMWEIPSGVDRVFNFRLTVRDNRAGGACNESDNMTVTVDNAYGPFAITSQSTSGISWNQGSTQTVTWSVNNTTALAGSANVNILLSTDGGLTFPTTLIANTPNDGTQTITVPNVSAPYCRLLIEPTGNDYYAINTTDFAIGYTVATVCTTYTSSPNANIVEQNPLAYQTFSVNVPDSFVISDVNVSTNLSHRANQVYLGVNHPDLSFVQLYRSDDYNCGNAVNPLITTFDDSGAVFSCAGAGTGNSYQPASPLAAFNGKNSAGTWRFRVADVVTTGGPSNSGTLNSFSVELCRQVITELVVACGTITSTWNGSAWSNGVPNKNVAVTINGNYNTATHGNLEACRVTVNSGFTLTIAANTYAQITNDLTVNATAVVDVLDQGSLVMTNDAGVVTNNGTMNVRKTSSMFDMYDYTFWSPPVVNATIGSAFSAWQQNYIYKLNTANFRDDNNDSHDDNQDAWVFTPQAEVMTSGRGYAVMGNTSGTFPKQQNVVFTGRVNNGVVNTPLSLSQDGTKNSDDFNLIGNPYPSAIKADDFITANAGVISGTLYFWTHEGNIQVAAVNPGPMGMNFSADDFAYYNLSGGTSTRGGLLTGNGNGNVPNGYIASGQGFQVDASANANAVFNNSMRSATYSNANFYRTASAPVEKDRLWLNLTNPEGIYSQQLIGFFPQATSGVDEAYDGFYVKSDTYAAFYSMINDTAYKIQGRGAFDVNDVVPLGFRSAYEKTYTVSIGDIEGVLRSQNVFLEDLQLNIVHNLKDSNYVFSTPAGEFNNRFVLRFTNTTLGNTDFETLSNAVTVYTNSEVNIASGLGQIREVAVYDVLGRLLAEKKNVNSNSTSFSTIRKTQSALIVKVTLESGQTVDKKILY